MTSIDNANRFITSYAQIESKMREMIHQDDYLPFVQLMKKCENKSFVIRKYYNELREYAELRNAIVHLRDNNNEIIAYPSDATVQTIEEIAHKLLENRPKAIDLATKPVEYADIHSSINKAYALMRKLSTSKLPIYDQEMYRGVLTHEMILEWKFYGNIGHQYVEDILPKQTKEDVLFLASDANNEDVIRAFDESLKKGNRLLAIMITQHGYVKEKPLGIITVQDLPKFTLI